MEIMDLEEKDIAKLQTNVMLSNISGSIFEIITGVFMVFSRDLALSKCHIGISPSGQKMGLWDQSQCHVQSIVGIDPNIIKKRVLGSVPMSCTGCNWD